MTGEGVCGLVVGSFEPLGYAMMRVRRRCNRAFSISSSRWVFKIGIRGLWSVINVKWLMPARKMLHFLMAQATARHSSSMTAYLLSVSVRNRDPACIVFHSSADFWRRTNPNPSVVYRRVSLVVSKYAKVGADVNAFLACAKASSCGCAHKN